MSKNLNLSSVCEEKVYESLYMEHVESLRNFLYYKCGNIGQAEDFAQEAFIRMWKNCAKVPFAKAKGFLYTVANNLFLNEVKHQKVVLKFQQRAHVTSSNQTPEFLLEEKEFHQRLEAAISNLPENQRIVFLMSKIEKKTYKEIAETLGLSVKAIEKRMSKALIEIRKLTRKI